MRWIIMVGKYGYERLFNNEELPAPSVSLLITNLFISPPFFNVFKINRCTRVLTQTHILCQAN